MPEAKRTAGTSTIFDALGSVVALSQYDNGNGYASIVERYAYSAFGETTVTLDGSTGNPYRFTARRWDAESDLYYYRARMYKPDLGRFLQPDPIGYDDGMNLYAYVGNNPGSWVDPFGLCKSNGWLDGLQLALDGAGMFPALGIFADAANTAISLGRGNFGEAGLNALAMIPIAGQFATGGKLARKGLKASDAITDLAKYGDDVAAVALKNADEPADLGNQKALRDLINEVTRKGRKPLSKTDADTVLEWAAESKYPDVRASAADMAKKNNHWVGGPHIHVPQAGKSGHVPIK